VTLKVLEDLPAGYVAKHRVTPMTAIRIMTGAPMPRGADSVVRVEYTAKIGEDQVRIVRPEGQAMHVRSRGEDIRKGEKILSRGKLLSPADIGLVASVGKNNLRVVRRARVALITTGDELVGPNEKLEGGKIVNTNCYTLSAVLKTVGAVPYFLGTARDRKKDLTAMFRKGRRYDAMITTGGVSVGDYDFVKESLKEAGMEIGFWKIAQKPGHPMAFGKIAGKPIFGLPGNPVSCNVGFFLYVRPALLKMMGHKTVGPLKVRAIIEKTIQSPAGLKEFVRCTLRRKNGQFYAASTGSQSSGVLRSLSLANGLIVSPESQTILKKGSLADVLVLDPGFLMEKKITY
jgi:molybdopterin molybdotransferase